MNNIRYESKENVIDTRLFENDKLTFTVLAGIVNNKSRLVITDHKKYVICHSTFPYPVWIWAAEDINEVELDEIWKIVKEEFPMEEGYNFNTKYFIADYLMKRSREEGSIPLEISLNMCTYDCQNPVEPLKQADGNLCIATKDDLKDAAVFLWQFKQDTGVDIETEEACLIKAENLIKKGKLYFWKNGVGNNVAMCSFSVDETVGKITHVYTKSNERRKGYAGWLVYEITCIVSKQGYLPVLYTDADYGASNECYKKIGYVERGTLCMVSACKVR